LHSSPIRLIALDIDGTLLDSHGLIPPANIDALTKAIGAGIEIVLATGRRFEFARPVFEQLPGPLTLILSNGAIIKTCGGETLLRQLLPSDVARRILAAVPRHRDTAMLLFDRLCDGQIVYERAALAHPRLRAFVRANRTFVAEVTPIEDALTEDPLQLMFTGGCAAMRTLFTELGNDPRATSYAVALTEYAHRDFSLVDILNAGCSKGATLREWAVRRGIAPAEVMAVGDNLNDLQMLEFAGHPVVMGNGLAELQERGWATTGTNDEAGVAQAIAKILPVSRGVQERGTDLTDHQRWPSD
jgi:Cof subfamily protein (haloacid dehalogenase superfamily)